MISVRFWGTRGSIPTPGPTTIKYGGNTSCVEVRIDNHILILDAGTGIRELGHRLLQEFQANPLTVRIFISHTHWDHIQGFPFFLPAYQPQNSIFVYGPPGRDKSLEEIMRDQMNTEYFPVALGDLSPNLEMHEMREPLRIGPIGVEFFFLNHPAMTLAYRITDGKRTLVYATDNEPYEYTLTKEKDSPAQREFGQAQDRKFVDFIANADLLIAEAQYTMEEYPAKVGWGHSPIESVVKFGVEAGVGKIALFHHDPIHDDAKIDDMVRHAQSLIAKNKQQIECFGAREGQHLTLE